MPSRVEPTTLCQTITCPNVRCRMSSHRPKLSDDDLLSTIFVLAGAASDASVCKALTDRLGQEIGLDYVYERLRRLDAAHLVSFASRRTPTVPENSTKSVRLTAAGVQRLCALQREPLCPETE
jgi:hypothetical protein